MCVMCTVKPNIKSVIQRVILALGERLTLSRLFYFFIYLRVCNTNIVVEVLVMFSSSVCFAMCIILYVVVPYFANVIGNVQCDFCVIQQDTTDQDVFFLSFTCLIKLNILTWVPCDVPLWCALSCVLYCI